MFANFSHEPAEELSERLLQLTGAQFSRVFFSDNGSTAVEVALKMAYQASAQNGQTRKNKFLAFSEAYHGDTAGAMSVSARGAFTKPYERMTFEILRAKQPRSMHAPLEEWTQDFKALIERHHEELAAVILEPLVQGAAGMIMWPASAVSEIAQLCREYGVYLIFDEVMTGFGRTGSMFAYEQTQAKPDFLCLSKGLTGGTLPLSVTLTTESVYEKFLSEEKARMFFHGHSFTGNALACAAAVANLKIFEKEETVAGLKDITRVHRDRLSRLQDRFPIQDARICGTIAAFEIRAEASGYTSRTTDGIFQMALDQGVFLRPLGSTLYLLPPYCSSSADLHHAWDTIAEVLGSL